MDARTSAMVASGTAPVRTGELDAFISYAHGDAAFAEEVVRLLEHAGRTAWLDVDKIPVGAPWREELGTAIEAATTIVFLVSDRWIESRECRKEFDRAVELGKRLVPVRLEPTRAIPEALGAIQWITPGSSDDPMLLAALLAAIDIDHDWARRHTEWLARAVRWERAERDPSLLARGSDLRAGRSWAQGGAGKDPAPTPLQLEFFESARRHERRRRIVVALAACTALVIAVVMALIASSQRHDAASQRTRAESQRLAAVALQRIKDDPVAAVRLAIRAVESRETSQAIDALRDAVLTSGLRRVQRVGRAPLARTVFSQDGRTLAVMDTAGVVHLEDARTGRTTATLAGGRPVGRLLLFTLGSRVLLTAGSDRTVRIWRVPGGQSVSTIRTSSRVVDLAVDRAGRTLVTADGDGPARLWRLPSGEASGTRGARASSVALSQSGRRLLVGDTDGRARRWSLPGRRSTVLARSNFPIDSVQLSRGGDAALIASPVGSSWIVRGGQRVGLATTADIVDGRGIFTESFSPDGRLVATGASNGTVAVWAVRTAAQLWKSAAHTGLVRRVAFSPDSRVLLSAGGTDRRVRIWDARTGDARATLAVHSRIEDLAFARDSRHAVTGAADGTLRTWDVTGESVWRGPGLQPHVIDVGVSHRGDTPLAASLSRVLDVRDLRTGDRVLGPAACRVGPESCLTAGVASASDRAPLRHAQLSPDGRRVITVSGSGRATLWDVRTGVPRAALGQRAVRAAFRSDGRAIVVADADGRASIWNLVPAIRRLVDIPVSRHALNDARFTPEGTRIATADRDGAVRVFDARSGRQELSGRRLSSPPTALATGARGLVAASAGQTVGLWHAGITGAPETLRGHTGDVTTLDFDPAGRMLVSGASDGTIRLWDVAAAAPIATLAVSRKAFESVAFLPDGTHVAVGGADGTVRVLDCDVCLPLHSLVDLARRRARLSQ